MSVLSIIESTVMAGNRRASSMDRVVLVRRGRPANRPPTNCVHAVPLLPTASAMSQSGAMPLAVSSLIAFSFFDRCVSPMPRSTFAALVN
jgi:hypothetical protein